LIEQPLLKKIDEDDEYPGEEDWEYFYKIEGDQDDEYYDEDEDEDEDDLDYYEDEDDDLEYYDEEEDEPEEYYDEEKNEIDYYEEDSEDELRYKMLEAPFNKQYQSVLKTPERDNDIHTPESNPDIVIKPRPSSTIMELDTAHILIMVGSAFISFGVVMMIFFVCRRSLESRQKEKSVASMPFVLSSPRFDTKKAPIVKDYQRVPTSTMEYMSNTHIEMYRGGGQENNPADQPLIQ